MKKLLINILLLGTAVVMLTGCKPSNLKNDETMFIPEGAMIASEPETTWKIPETSKYVIPENAETGEFGGPGAMETTAVDYSMYPEGKRPVAATPEDENTTLVILYRQNDLGLMQDFDAVEVCDAESLIGALQRNGAFKEGTEVVDFTVGEDMVGDLTLSALNIYSTRDRNVVVAGIANTFIDNLQLKSINITIGDEDLGNFEFTTEY
ncbi:MAG: hypothetical protein Q4E57_01305 [Eubacteriales bacterium]|nr:hypothetical protein [Eubacteriales bacterium]